MPTSDELTAAEQAIKDAFKEDVGYWDPSFDHVLREDATFFERYREWYRYPYESDALDPVVKEFILIAAYSQTTHMRPDGIRRHIRRAFDAGATFEEILEVLQITTVLSVHSYMIGAKILDDVLGISEQTDDAVIDGFLDTFEEKRKYRPEWWGPYIAPDPDYFETYTEFSGHPWEEGVLEPKVREFIYIAIDATPAHLLEEGIEGHMENAVEYGATQEELAEVFELVSLLSLDTLAEGLPILVEEAQNH